MEDLNNNVTTEISTENYTKKPVIFIDQLLSKHEGVSFSEQDIKDHVFTMVSAVSFISHKFP